MMKAYLDLFTIETWQAFIKKGSNVSGYRDWGRKLAAQVNPGDIFICYVVGLSRWIGALRVLSKYHEDSTPIFHEQNDPYVI